PIIERSNTICEKIEQANCAAKRDPHLAIGLYRDAISDIYDLHFDDPSAEIWRRVSYPINELSGLLERIGDFKAAYQAIRDYEGIRDSIGLAASDLHAMQQRKFRLEKRFIF